MATTESRYRVPASAWISKCGSYRYSLWRRWSGDKTVMWVMLNPSTADARTNDATIRRCLAFSRAWGYGALEVVNLFGLRARNPKELQRSPDPVGPRNDAAISDAFARCSLVVIAWGARGELHERDRAVLRLLRKARLYTLGTTSGGQPRHPLRMRADTPLAEVELAGGRLISIAKLVGADAGDEGGR